MTLLLVTNLGFAWGSSIAPVVMVTRRAFAGVSESTGARTEMSESMRSLVEVSSSVIAKIEVE
jgi:hypothetical protein